MGYFGLPNTIHRDGIRLGTILLLILGTGCGRHYYLRQADEQAYRTLAEKTADAAWAPPIGFNILPDPDSRFADPTDPTSPQLPATGPRLYKAGFVNAVSSSVEPKLIMESAENVPPGSAASAADDSAAVLRVIPVSPTDWDAIPLSCRQWMLEFDSVRREYEQSFEKSPSEAERVAAPKLTLQMIMELALIHSREYQTQKETLYRNSLNLTLERYDYALHFNPFANRTTPNFVHDRSNATTVNRLSVPTALAGSQVLATGGEFVARFANDVLLTFNGPSGFTADVGSQMLLQLSQSLFQRDVVLENLTQSERNVIYAARDFARFRKTFFSGLANRYYDLLLTYRGIEIGAQDYFSTARAFHQGQAEYQANRLPRFQVDQFEQNALRSLSNLIRNCNSLERSLDDFKIQIGLPPELLIHLNLGELEWLTASDEATVREELLRRARRVILEEQAKEAPDPTVLFSQGIELARRCISLDEARKRSAQMTSTSATTNVQQQLSRLSADEAWHVVWQNEKVYESSIKEDAPVVQRFQRTLEFVASLREALSRELAVQQSRGETPDPSWLQLEKKWILSEAQLQENLEKSVSKRQLGEIEALMDQASLLLQQVKTALVDFRQIRGEQWQDRAWVQARIQPILASCDRALATETKGLPNVEIEHDQALLTALARRWDLANEREQVADQWRQIKFAADRLRAAIDVTAGLTLRTPDDVNRAFDFSLDDSSTQLQVSLDAPFNRRAERNSYRQALIAYQSALRNWISAEDRIKRDVRQDLRRLQVDQQQFAIAVASAALAQERVLSTRLQLQLGIGGIVARDFLEAQQAYTTSLSAVAAEHIGFLTDRISLFLNLEQLTVDEGGFWPALYNESYKPQADYRLEMSGDSPYGSLVPGLRYSKHIRQMLSVPTIDPPVLENTNEVQPSDGPESVQTEE